MLIAGALVVLGTSPEWVQVSNAEVGYEIRFGIGNEAMAQVDAGTETRWVSTCSRSVYQAISVGLTFGILFIALAWIAFFTAHKALQAKAPLLKWFVSAFLASLALFGTGLFVKATIDLNACDLVEVEQLHSTTVPNK